MKQQNTKQLDSIKDQIKRQAGIFPANKHQADPVPFELQETSLLDPSIIYAVHQDTMEPTPFRRQIEQ